MVSTENVLVVGFGVAALVLGYGIFAFTTLPSWVAVAVVLVVGLVAPQLVRGYVESRE